ncbi:nose resistant to fluoxetine protein 6-like [Homarus americanus]|uniref:nose resistant to fluoxetine protein 6-like n=1 Tax=Homarus americanus TaxID=6706 RepID=UPI001C45A8D6|nr:nose resistant to fluoxetine protein 6-like [Homarus americanus]
MTGLVLTYRLLPTITSHRPATQLLLFCTAFLRRFFRLAPTIFCVSLFCASLLRFLAYGPRAQVLRSFSQDQCADHWWKDPLFVNNFILGENKGFNVNDCLDNCWYTAVDMQLLLILPVLLMPIAYFGFVGLVSLSLVTLLAILVPLIITIVYNLPPSPLHYIPSHTQFEYMWRVYLVPWCRAGPWLVGVWCAFLLRQPTVSRVKISKVIVVLGYVAAVSLGLILVLGLYPYNHVFPDEKYINYPTMSAVYGALARPVWGLCVAWVVFTCHTGNADMVDRILSYPGWRPLARLTFCMYLVAPVVQLWWSSVQYVPNYYNYLNKLFESAGVMFIAGVVSILLTCIIELPVNFVFDLFIPSSAKKQERMVKMVTPSKVSHDI